MVRSSNKGLGIQLDATMCMSRFFLEFLLIQIVCCNLIALCDFVFDKLVNKVGSVNFRFLCICSVVFIGFSPHFIANRERKILRMRKPIGNSCSLYFLMICCVQVSFL